MLPHARALLGAALTAAVLICTGCGSSSSSTQADKAPAAKPASPTTQAAATPAPAPTPTAKAPTKAAYVRKADKVCAAAANVSKSANTVVQKAFAVHDLTRAAEAIDNYTPMFAQRVAELKALPRPAGARPAGAVDAKLLTGLMKVMDGQVQALRDEAGALRQQDNATLQQISKAQQTEQQFADTLGRQYGFRVCGLAA